MSKTTRFLVLLLLAFSAGLSVPRIYGQPSKTSKSKSVAKTAKEHLRFEEFEQAIPYLQQLLKEEPSSAYYNFWMGKCLYLNYKKNQALKYFEVVNSTDPAVDREFHYYYALALHYNLRFDDAIAEYALDLNRYEPGSDDYNWVNNRIAQCAYAKKLVNRKEGDQVKITNVGDKINTEYAEHSPVISANDSVLIFTARRPDCLGAQPEVNFYDEDLYISTKVGGKWSEATNIATPVNSKGHDATIALNAEGTTLFIYRHKKDGGLYVTDFDQAGNEWREPRKVEKPLNSKYYEASICISEDSTKMFFTSDRPGGFGGLDIYMVEKKGENDWSEPVNMGPMINTPFNEDAPYFHPDNKTLYYSSDGPKSMGGYDIYVTEWDSTRGVWLECLNMGHPVNTPDDDIYFVLSASGKYGYYSSGKEGGFGEKDIYQIEFPYYPYPRRYFIVDLVGTVKEEDTDSDLPAMVYLVDKESNERLDSMVTDSENKSYYFVLEPGKTYNVEVESDGFTSMLEEFTAPTPVDEDLTVKKPVRLVRRRKPVAEVVPKEAPRMPEIQHIYYDFDKYGLREQSQNELDMVADFLRTNPNLAVNILAHTDWYGTYDYNVTLSMNRANAAYNYLLSKGITPAQLSKSHFSEVQPIESNENDQGRQFNRRVEFDFVMDGKTVFHSVKLRTGAEGVPVDHTRPKGLPGFDNPNAGGGTGNPDPVTEPVGEAGSEEIVKAPDATVDLAGLQLHNIYFDFDKSDIRSEAHNNLQNVADLLKAHPDMTLEIWGHTDAYGSNDYNQRLSERRCNASYNYLLDLGLRPDQIRKVGFSEEKPIDSNVTDGGRQNNRRVEFRVLQGGKPIYISIP